jgi:hypothetical protein
MTSSCMTDAIDFTFTLNYSKGKAQFDKMLGLNYGLCTDKIMKGC